MVALHQPDFKTAKVIALLQRYKIKELRVVEPIKNRSYRPDMPLALLAEFATDAKHTPESYKFFISELSKAIDHPITMQNMEEIGRHTRFTLITSSKVVYA